MRRPRRPIVFSFALASCVAMVAPTFAAPVARSPVPDAQIELAGGGLQQRCWMAETPQGPQRRCRGGGSDDDRSWGGDPGKDGRGARRDSGDSGSRSGWSGAYGGWNGGYGSGQSD